MKKRQIFIRYKGGPGSGHFGHSGIPGKQGGSLPEGEGSDELDMDSIVSSAMSKISEKYSDETMYNFATDNMSNDDKSDIEDHIISIADDSNLTDDEYEKFYDSVVSNFSKNTDYGKYADAAGKVQRVMNYALTTNKFGLDKKDFKNIQFKLLKNKLVIEDIDGYFGNITSTITRSDAKHFKIDLENIAAYLATNGSKGK